VRPTKLLALLTVASAASAASAAEYRDELDRCALAGDCTRVAQLLEEGAPVFDRRRWRQPLHRAAGKGHYCVVGRLLEAGADVEGVDRYGASPLYRAAYSGHVEVARLLLESGARIDAANIRIGITPIHAAALAGRLAVVELLIERGHRLELLDRQGRTPLALAATVQHPDVVAALLEAGSEVMAIDSNGWSPLHHATWVTSWRPTPDAAATARALVAAGADVNDRDPSSGNTALHHAARSGLPALVELLLTAGADPMARNDAHLTPLHLLVSRATPNRDRSETALLLLERGADPNAGVLHLVRSDPADAALCLIEHGADVNPPHPSGHTLLANVVARGSAPEAAAMLRRHGARFLPDAVDGREARDEDACLGHPGLEPTVDVMPRLAAPYEPIYLTVSWHNDSDRSRRIWFRGFGCGGGGPWLDVATDAPWSIWGEPESGGGPSGAVLAPGECAEHVLDISPRVGSSLGERDVQVTLGSPARVVEITTLTSLSVPSACPARWRFRVTIEEPHEPADRAALALLRELTDGGSFRDVRSALGMQAEQITRLGSRRYHDAAAARVATRLLARYPSGDVVEHMTELLSSIETPFWRRRVQTYMAGMAQRLGRCQLAAALAGDAMDGTVRPEERLLRSIHRSAHGVPPFY